MSLPRYPVFRVMADLRYAGMWFRVEGDDLFVTGNTAKLTDDLRGKIAHHKPDIIAALNQLPPACHLPTVCLNAGYCAECEPITESERAA